MKKPLKTCKVNVRGFSFECRLFADIEFNRIHNEEGLEAVTIWPTKRIDFKVSTFTQEIVKHEILHAFLYTSLNETANLDAISKEENAAEVFAYFGEQMIQISKEIYKRFSK